MLGFLRLKDPSLKLYFITISYDGPRCTRPGLKRSFAQSPHSIFAAQIHCSRRVEVSIPLEAASARPSLDSAGTAISSVINTLHSYTVLFLAVSMAKHVGCRSVRDLQERSEQRGESM